MLVQIAVCKCHPKFTPGGAESAASPGGKELAVYKEVNEGEGGVAVSDPTYTEMGAGRGNTMVLKENEAYGAAIAIK